MKYFRQILLGLLILFTFSLIFLSILSRFKASHGLVDGKLAKCPATTNCICSEDHPNQNYQPIAIDLKKKPSAWTDLKSAIAQAGGDIRQDDGHYLWATFVTPVFRFVDDFEARLDTVEACIHLRSASRVGQNDFGTNLRRVNLVVQIYLEN